ncbi:hypothetical protein KBC79_02350 [Candidatus Woesebacteria bacterium]|nr:hypothetical protein [Candidatus Woesebacteria bacterium]
MIKEIPHPSPNFSDQHLARVVRFLESPIGKSEQVHIALNSRYLISEAELRERMYLSGQGTKSEEKPLPQITMTRGREAGSALEPVLLPKRLADGSTYDVVGIISVKGLGLRDLRWVAAQSHRKSSMGVVGITETMIDVNVGELLTEDGASIGDYIAILSVPKEVFFQHFEDSETGGSGGKTYAAHLRKFWQNDAEYRNRDFIHGIARITDPERLDVRTFIDPVLLLRSASWLQAELSANGIDKFCEYYCLPPGYADHLQYMLPQEGELREDIQLEQNVAHIVSAQARLLAYIITRNYAVALRNGINTSFSYKDIGNLGKLHDFPLAMNKYATTQDTHTREEADAYVRMTTYSFEQLVTGVFFNNGVQSYLTHHSFVAMCSHLSKHYQVVIDAENMIELAESLHKPRQSSFVIELG